MTSIAINALALCGLGLQGYGLFEALGVGVAAAVVGTELLLISIVGAFRAG